jgi:hypothetical protein
MINSKTNALLKSVMGVMQDNYPENLGKSYIVNSPFVFTGVWKIVKNFLDEKTVEKVSLYSYGQEELLEAIDEDQLIDFLGGKNKMKLTDDRGLWDNYDVFDGY